jgi:hypothetical protein
MPTNRTRRRRPRHDVWMPDWARRLLAGDVPGPSDPAEAEFFGWAFMADVMPGLPAADSREGRALWLETSRAN